MAPGMVKDLVVFSFITLLVIISISNIIDSFDFMCVRCVCVWSIRHWLYSFCIGKQNSKRNFQPKAENSFLLFKCCVVSKILSWKMEHIVIVIIKWNIFLCETTTTNQPTNQQQPAAANHRWEPQQQQKLYP